MATLLACACLGAACRDAPVEPYTPSGPPPSGLSATFSVDPRARGQRLPDGPTITARGDSLVATAVLSDMCPADRFVQAGVTGQTLVVTYVDSLRAGRLCTLAATASNFRVVVRAVPRGVYTVVQRMRSVGPYQAPQEFEVQRRPFVVVR